VQNVSFRESPLGLWRFTRAHIIKGFNPG